MDKYNTAVLEKQTISPVIFDNIINSLECDTGECTGQIGFLGSYRHEETSKSESYFINFYGDAPNYRLQIDPNATYLLEQKIYSLAEIVHLSFSKEQKAELQALINKKVLEVTVEEERAKNSNLHSGLSFNPYEVFGVKEVSFI